MRSARKNSINFDGGVSRFYCESVSVCDDPGQLVSGNKGKSRCSTSIDRIPMEFAVVTIVLPTKPVPLSGWEAADPFFTLLRAAQSGAFAVTTGGVRRPFSWCPGCRRPGHRWISGIVCVCVAIIHVPRAKIGSWLRQYQRSVCAILTGIITLRWPGSMPLE